MSVASEMEIFSQRYCSQCRGMDEKPTPLSTRILMTITLAFLVTMALIAKRGYGIHKSTLYVE